MRNHDQKTKDMIESVLPSAARQRARAERREMHHSRRACEAQALYQYLRAADYDYPTERAKTKSDLEEFVWSRRAADKVGPLTRWAVRRIAADTELRDAPVHQQLDYFRAMLPSNLVGEHALTHIEWALEWETRRSAYGRSASRRVADADRRARIAALTEQLRRIVSTGRHGELNRRIKSVVGREAPVPAADRRAPATPRRLLLGVHDVDTFARDVHGSAAICAIVAKLAGRRR